MAASESTTTGLRDALPYIAFATDGAQFLFETSPGTSIEESATTMRVVIAQLGHAEWGLIASKIGSTSGPDLTMMIDSTFSFYANEFLGTLKLARHVAVPHGDWTTYEVRFASSIDFVDCVRAVAEAKSQVLYHCARIVDAMVEVFQQQFPTGALVDENADGSSVVAAGPRTAVAAAAGTSAVTTAPVATAAATTATATSTAIVVVDAAGPEAGAGVGPADS